MSGRSLIAWLSALLLSAAGTARAEESAATEPAERAPAAEQELGARMGLEMGGRTSPGGLALDGNYLYRLSDQDWFDGSLGIVVGSGDAACFRDRDDSFVCDHGRFSGGAFEAAGAVRRFLPGADNFVPYVRAGVAARLVRFPGDGVTGLAIPLLASGGVRAKVADQVTVVGGAELRVGPAFFNKDLGTEPHITLRLTAGAEFSL